MAAAVFEKIVAEKLVSYLIRKLSLTVQNAAARVIIGTRNWKFDHITPVLRDLHWLPVRQHITFKLAMMVYKWGCTVWHRG